MDFKYINNNLIINQHSLYYCIIYCTAFYLYLIPIYKCTTHIVTIRTSKYIIFFYKLKKRTFYLIIFINKLKSYYKSQRNSTVIILL